MYIRAVSPSKQPSPLTVHPPSPSLPPPFHPTYKPLNSQFSTRTPILPPPLPFHPSTSHLHSIPNLFFPQHALGASRSYLLLLDPDQFTSPTPYSHHALCMDFLILRARARVSLFRKGMGWKPHHYSGSELGKLSASALLADSKTRIMRNSNSKLESTRI